MGDLDQFEITAHDRQTKWRVVVAGGTGGALIDVDKDTGKATIVQIQQ